MIECIGECIARGVDDNRVCVYLGRHDRIEKGLDDAPHASEYHRSIDNICLEHAFGVDILG
jgi:hypothetical protein